MSACLTTGAVSSDCFDSVPLHAVLKDEKWTACSEHEAIGLHTVSYFSQEAEIEGDRGSNSTCARLYVCTSELQCNVNTCVLYQMQNHHSQLCVQVCSGGSCSFASNYCSCNATTDFLNTAICGIIICLDCIMKQTNNGTDPKLHILH